MNDIERAHAVCPANAPTGYHCCRDGSAWPCCSSIAASYAAVRAEEQKKARTEIERLRAHAGHRPSCVAYKDLDYVLCDCGFSATLAPKGEGDA